MVTRLLTLKRVGLILENLQNKKIIIEDSIGILILKSVKI